MKYILVLAICLSFFSCAVVTTRAPVSTANAPVVPATQAFSWNTSLGLNAYPNSQLLDSSTDKNGSSKITLSSNADFDDIYAYIHQQLSAKGWQRTDFDYKNKATKLEATYKQNVRSFRLKFDAEGKSGRFKLEFDF